MENTTFLKRVLADGGEYCLLALKPDTRKIQKFYPTVDRLVHAAEELDADGYDTYFGLGTFDGKGTRKAEHVLHMSSLYVDLDCGEDKDYAETSEALDALGSFCKTVGMPHPIMVLSGYGLHAYWLLAEPVPVVDWKPVAVALKRTCAAHGLHIDPSVTADAARVLRVPGTHNHKRGGLAPVILVGVERGDPRELSWFADLLQADVPAPTPSATLFDNVKMKLEDDPVMQRLLRNRESSFKKILQKSLSGKGCEQLVFAATKQAEVEEPIWRAALSIAKFCDDGAKAAHNISREHPEYSAESTEAKMSGIMGPYTCDTFDSNRPGVCGDCPLRGKITSPIQLGTVFAEAETEEVEDEITGEPVVVYKGSGETQDGIPKYPFPFFRGSSGGVFVKDKDGDNDTVDMEVYPNDIYFTKRVLDYEAGECVIGKLHLPNDTPREFLLPLVAATSKEDLRKILAKTGVVTGAKRWDMIMVYTQKWIEQLQTTTVADTARTQFGWSDNSFTSYVLGDREIFADKVGYNPPSSKTAYLFPALRPRGTLEGWKAQAEFYNRDGLEPYQFVVCHALAAPLMRLTPVHAAIFDFYSDGSGHGKSTTQKFALTIYGDPGELIVGPKDTLNARMNRMEVMKDVNLQFDEFTEFPAEQTSDLIYGATDGRQKARMSSGSNEERHRGEPWHTTLTSSSNYSMLAKVYAVKANPQAEEQRVLRYHVQPHNFTDKTETDLFAKSVGDHAGHAAEVFVQQIMRDPATAKELLDSVQRKLDAACGLTMQNRFWSVQGAVTITALILAREAGLLDYDPGKMFKWTVQLINNNKRDTAEAKVSVEALINDFVHENYGSILWIKSTDDLRGAHNANGLDSLVVPEMQPKVKLVARYETDVKMLYIVMKALKVWCVRQRLNYDSVVMELGEKMGARKQKMRMCKGTKMNLPAATVLAVDCASMDLPETPDGGSKD
jgi:hypothetical protein